MSEPISVGSVSVDVVPDARGFDEKLKAELRDLTIMIRAQIDRAELDAQIAEATRERDMRIRANLDDTDAAARLDLLTRPRDVNIRADSSGLDSVASASRSASGGLGGLLSVAVLLAPALIPLAAAIGGVAAALAAPVLAATGGGFLFALVAGKVVSQTEAQNKQIEQLAKNVTAAKKNLAAAQQSAASSPAHLTPSSFSSAGNFVSFTSPSGGSGSHAGSSNSVAAAQTKLNDAVAAYDKALKGLTPTQVAFLKAQDRLKESFKTLIVGQGSTILAPVIKGMDLLAVILPKLQPLLKSVGGAISDVLDSMLRAVKSGGFSEFVKGFAALAGPSIRILADIMRNVASGAIGFLKTFAPLGLLLLGVIDKAAGSFAKFSQGGGFQKFADYVVKIGPTVAKFFGSLGTLIGHLITALAPLGGVILQAIAGLADALNKLPTDVLLGLVAGIGGIVAFAGGPVVAIAAGVAALVALFIDWYNHSKQLRDILAQTGHWITGSLWPALKQLGSAIGKNLQPVIAALVSTFKQDFLPTLKKVWPDIKTIAENVGKLVGGFLLIVSVIAGKVLPVLIELAGFLFKKLGPQFLDLVKILTTVVVLAFKSFVDLVLGSIGVIVDGVAHAFGWVPGIGKHLKAAAREFDTFKNNVNKSLSGILDKHVAVKVAVSGPAAPGSLLGGIPLFAGSPRGPVPNAPTIGLLPTVVGARANGGDVRLGQTYKVEERGGETFTAFTAPANGYITAHGRKPPGGQFGPQFYVENVYAQDVNHLLNQMQTRSRHSASDGIAR